MALQGQRIRQQSTLGILPLNATKLQQKKKETTIDYLFIRNLTTPAEFLLLKFPPFKKKKSTAAIQYFVIILLD